MNTSGPLYLNGEVIDRMDTFKYVGIWFNGKGIDPDKMVKDSIAKAWRT